MSNKLTNYLKRMSDKPKTNGPHANRWLIGIVFVALGVLTVAGYFTIVTAETVDTSAGYNAIGFGIIMLWASIFLGYFIWATYFYNLNYGTSKAVWTKIEAAKHNKANSKIYDQSIIDDEPLYNPYKDQTFGLPPGTVRGMIAFTLLFGALALLVVSFGMKGELEPGSFFRDQFEFFKTAFLMMVAFYFGSQSLKYLKKETPLPASNTVNSLRNSAAASNSPPSPDPGGSAVTGPPPAPTKPQVVVLGPKNPGQPGSNPPITAIDPMS